MTWLDDNADWLARARERWAPRRSNAWRLRVWLSSHVAYDGRDPITIEGALQFIVAWRETGRSPDDVFAWIPRDLDVDIQIPIADVEIGGVPIACCSVGWWPSIAEEGLRWRRKRADADCYGLEKLMINGGWGKSLNIPVATIVTPWLDFYLVGDRELLDDLLRDAGGIGRDSTRGLGSILGWEWAPDVEERSLLHRGAPQRILPMVEDGGDFDVSKLDLATFDAREATTRAPYWVQRRARPCVVPVQRIGDLA